MALSYETLSAYISGLHGDGILTTQEYNDIILYILANGEISTSARDLIQVRRGNLADLPILAQGEIGFTLDEENIYIGGVNGNVGMGNKDIINQHTKQLVDIMKQNDILTRIKGFKFIAHRGINEGYPENTLLSIMESGSRKFNGAEMDISITIDDNFVLMHDETVDRTTNGTGRTIELTLSQIKALNIDAPLFPNTKVPTLEEALLQCKLSGVIAFLDIKYTPLTSAAFTNLIEVIKSTGMLFDTILSTKFLSIINIIREIDKNVYISYNKDVTLADVNDIKDIPNICCFILPALTSYDIPDNVVDLALLNNIPILSFIAADYQLLKSAVSKGLTGVVSDNIKGGI